MFLKVGRISILPLISSYKLFPRVLLLFRGIVPGVISFSFIYKAFASWFLVGTGTRTFVSVASIITSGFITSAIASTLVVALVCEVGILVLYKVDTSAVLF